MDDKFSLVGIRPTAQAPPLPVRRRPPLLSGSLLALILLGCLLGGLLSSKDPGFLDLANSTRPPCREFPFGTDTMGRDLFSMIWSGGRISLLIGVIAAAISTLAGIVFGAVSGLGPRWLDALLMRATELLLCIPNLLLIILLQALLGKPNPWSIALVIGLSSWTNLAKVVRTQVQQLRNSDYVLASRAMGGGFWHILRWHLLPNILPSILFMVVINLRGAILAESTLSFLGMGLPLEVISWGSMLSLSQNALASGAWWIILIPGVFLVVTLLCLTELGNALQKALSHPTGR